MAKKNRIIVKLKSTESSHVRTTVKNPKQTTERLELKKHDPVLKRHVVYKESK